MIEALRERIVHMLHTLEGSKVAMNCIWHGTKKVTHHPLIHDLFILYFVCLKSNFFSSIFQLRNILTFISST